MQSWMLGAGMALMVTGAADAQMGRHGPGAPYPMPGRQVVPGPGVNRPPMPQPPQMSVPRMPVRAHGPRWGSNVGGRWWGGANAPGGWAAYRQPFRGYRVPGYWVAPCFYVGDWQHYGLYQPQGGYQWVRYYDDAVLVDGSGGVQDWRGGLDWNGGDYAYDESEVHYTDADGRRPSNGVGGAVAGAVVGGVAGNVIAGRGNRLGGTLIGAGVGAAAGYAIDRNSGRGDGRRGPPPGYDGRYDDVPMATDGPPPPMIRERREGRDVVVRTYERGRVPTPPMAGPSTYYGGDGGTTVTTTTSGGGYANGYGGGAPVIVTPGYGYGGSVTTVTIQTAPMVTTTTTEIIEDSVTYTRPVVRRAVRRVHRAPVRVRARPRCICR